MNLSWVSPMVIDEDVNGTEFVHPLLTVTNTSNQIEWTLLFSTPTSNAFDISCSTGTVCYLGYNETKNGGTPLFDYQEYQQYRVFIQVNDTEEIQVEFVTVNIRQVIQDPTIASNGGTISIVETSPANTHLAQISASDPQGYLPLKYTISKILPRFSNEYFTVNSAGVLSTTAVAKLNYTDVPVWTIFVDVANSGIPPRTSTFSLTVSITDAGHAPRVLNLPDTRYIYEDISPGTEVFTIRFSDPDIFNTTGVYDISFICMIFL